MTDVRSAMPTVLPDVDRDPRLRASMERLLREDYEVSAVIARTRADAWPGDLAGRLLLSLSRLARAGLATGERAEALNTAMLHEIDEQGYFGPPLGEIADEQQVACHGWVVAGLLQYSFLTGDRRSRDAAFRVIDQLILPVLNRGDYPWARDGGPGDGGPSGTASETVGGWLLSSDVWCVLLTLNALVPAAIESGREDLAAMITVFVGQVGHLDVVAHRAQLHAVLAAARNLADWARETHDAEAQEAALSLYRSYVNHARTLNYATYNWFGRPDSWTEPCATVDSLGAAWALYDLTGDVGYREDAVRIARNGLDFAERQDGSFGLDSVTTSEAPVLTPIAPDAHWCCTMRGAVGLLEARECSVRFDHQRNVLDIADFYPSRIALEADSGHWVVQEQTDGPAGSTATLIVEECSGAQPLPVELSREGTTVALTLSPTAGARHAGTLPDTPVEGVAEGVLLYGPVLAAIREDGSSPGPCTVSEVAGSFAADEHPRLRLIRTLP